MTRHEFDVTGDDTVPTIGKPANGYLE